MQSVPVYRFWQFGTTVRYLQDVREGFPVHGVGNVLHNIGSMFERLNELDLQVTIRAAYEISAIQDEFTALPKESKTTSDQATRLNKAVKALRQTMEAELRGIHAYTISPKRLDVEKLTDDVASLFAPGVFDSLSPVAKLDVVEAGKCIAFERPTAAAFHLMRATEEVLRSYYCFFVKRDRLSPMLWFPLVQALQQHRKAKVHDTLHRQLDNIRVSFRNPTQHPDKVYDIQEAQDLLGLCVDAINRMRRICNEGAA